MKKQKLVSLYFKCVKVKKNFIYQNIKILLSLICSMMLINRWNINLLKDKETIWQSRCKTLSQGYEEKYTSYF